VFFPFQKNASDKAIGRTKPTHFFQGGKTMRTKILAAFAFLAILTTMAFAQTTPYPPEQPADYIEKDLYSPPVYAKAQDWLTCSISNYFPDVPLYADIKIYDTDGNQVYPTNGTTPTPPPTQPPTGAVTQQQTPSPDGTYTTPPWGVSYYRYQVPADGYYWCWLKVYKPSAPTYEGWGRGTWAYEPAGNGYPIAYVPVNEEKNATTTPTP
jgi:hypothetical protein